MPKLVDLNDSVDNLVDNRLEEVSQQLSAMTELTKVVFDPKGGVDWGHFGSLTSVVDLLERARAILASTVKK